MDSGARSPDGNLVDILAILESKTTGNTERLETYQKFTSLYKENQISLFDIDVVKNIDRVLAVIKQDILLQTAPDVSQSALQVLGVCVHDSEIVRSMSSKDCENILDSLVDCIHKTNDKGKCSRALWCIGKQNLDVEAVRKKVTNIVEAVESAVEKFGNQSVSVEHESINTIARLAEQCPREMEKESGVWGKLLLPTIANLAIKVRERGLFVTEVTTDLMKTHRKEIVTGVMPVFKSKVLPELQKLFSNKHELFVLKCWGHIVQAFGEELHHGSHINHILPVVEMGFKSTCPEVRIAAFNAWQQLIDNFASNPNVLSDPKRVKLIMQVFKSNNAKQENIAEAKLKVWWHYIWMLGSKINANFDMVAVPLLHFCLGGSKDQEHGGPPTPRLLPNGTSPKTPQMNLTTSSSQLPVFQALQLAGCEVLAHFLGATQRNMLLIEHDFKLDQLRHDVVTGPTFFIKQSNLFITTATELFISLGKDLPESLLFHIWDSLIGHLKTAIDGNIKLDIRDTLSTLLTRFQVVVLSRVLSSQIVLKMFQSICQLPGKILSSSAYSIGRNEISGTPALFLAGLLLTPNLLQAYSGQENYHTQYRTIIGSGVSNSSGTLGFLQSVLEFINSNGRCVEDREMIWRLWSSTVNPLLEHISRTNEVNQGDSLEPNFDCCIKALVLPVELNLSSLPQPTVKVLVKTWTEMYKTIDRLAALVVNANANVICEDVCSRIVQSNTQKKLEAENMDLQIQICHVVVSCLDFSSLGTQITFNIAPAYSPKKPMKKSLKPLGNIHSLVTLLCHLQKCVLEIVGDLDQKKPTVSSQSMLNTLVDIYSTVFSHINSSSVISQLIGQLAEPIGKLFTEASKKTCVKLYNNAFQQKLEKLWMDLTTCIQSRYQGLSDSEFLSKISPLLEATFLHSRRQIKNQTGAFWTSTFGAASKLTYPETLKPILMKVKEKSTIHLPGWININTPVIEETPISQMSQSQVPEPRLPGMPSPHKIHGSFLNKGLSPRAKKSPMKSPTTAVTRSTNSAKKKVFKGLESSNDDDFVVIKTSPRKKMVLTEHQKEIMKERRVLPAMYNNLELSMDTSLMSSHFTTDTQMESSSSTPTPTLDKEPFSLFGSSLRSGSDQSQDKTAQDDKGTPSKAKNNVKEATTVKAVNKSIQQTEDSTSINTRNKKTAIKSPDSTSESNKRPRRSTSIKKQQGDKASEASDKVNEKDKGKELGEKIAESDVSDNKVKENSVIVIEESEPMDTEPSQCILRSETAAVEIDLTEESQGTFLSQSGSTSNSSVPQNILGAIGQTPPLSTNSSESTKSGDKVTVSGSNGAKKNDKTPQKGEIKKVDSETSLERELPSSEPLFSWAQKLEELSQSPGLKKSPFKKSLSQDSKSPNKRSSSPLKSPRRKAKENLSMQGALDKWIIRSPKKSVGKIVEQCVESEVVVQSALSCTFVEETQSPTKFKKTDEPFDKANSPSVMETPTKNILEEINVNHSHSNRKLFDSQGSNHGNDVEDSNMIPASPNSTSYTIRNGTPIVRMTKLSDEDIRRFSPNNKFPADITNLTPTKNDDTNSKPRIMRINVDFKKNMNEDESSHEHDDFSDLKPLENDTDCNNLFSKSLTSTDKALLLLDDELGQTNKRAGKSTEKSAQAVSPVLFSQLDKQSPNNECDKVVTGLENDSNRQLINDCESKEMSSSQGFSTDSQSQNEAGSQENAISLDRETPRRGRKRKQITPKKFSPDDLKQKPKRGKHTSPKDNEINSDRKISNRLKERKERELLKNSQEDGKDAHDKQSELIKDSEADQGSEQILFEQELTNMKLDGSQPSDEGGNQENSRSAAKKKCKGSKLNNTKVSPKNNAKVSPKDKKDSVISENTENNSEKDIHTNTVMDTTSDKESVIINVENVLGETTPKCRATAKQSERKSTTKHKKEISQKMDISCQDNRDELIIDNNSNLCMEDTMTNSGKIKVADKVFEETSEDLQNDKKGKCVNEFVKCDENIITEKIMDMVENEVIKAVTKKLVEEENAEHGNLSEELVIDDKGAEKYSRSDISSVSSDDVPLSKLKLKGRKKKVDGKKQNKKEEELQKSPVSNKLRSKKLVGTRLRSGRGKEKSSPPAKKSVNLALKRTRMKNKKNLKEKIDEEDVDKEITSQLDGEEDVDADAMDPLVSIDKVEKEFEKETVKSSELEDKIIEINDDKIEETEIEIDSLQDVFNSEIANDKAAASGVAVEEAGASTNETPRKALEISKQAASMLIMNSDSKLVLGSRRFEKRKAVARRSILKPTVASLSSQVNSPKKNDFHPISVYQVYSPTASPSASILKKRRLMDHAEMDTSSPPTKQRRVSFAEPLIEEGNTDGASAAAMDETDPTKSAEKSGSVSEKNNDTQSTETQSSSIQSSGGNISQATYQSTQESQLNSTEPVCPDLIDCDQSVEKVLPQLTSSVWSRGLGQLIRARNIKTIGDLSALSENDIQRLPIRSPKVETVRKTLSKYRNLQTKSLKIKEVPKVRLETNFQEANQENLDEDPIPKPKADAENDKADMFAPIRELVQQMNSSADHNTSMKLFEDCKELKTRLVEGLNLLTEAETTLFNNMK